jgi:hypothetical protein
VVKQEEPIEYKPIIVKCEERGWDSGEFDFGEFMGGLL